MSLFERIIRALIYLAFIALAYYLILWVLGAIGIMVPMMVERILGVILALVAILVLVRLFYDAALWDRLFPPR
ncbi:MAG TPA: hypothetical protein VGH47_14260 [Xanthobacteraceae bacterium]